MIMKTMSKPVRGKAGSSISPRTVSMLAIPSLRQRSFRYPEGPGSMSYGVDLAPWAHSLGQVDGIPAAAGPDLADDHARLDAGDIHDLGGRLELMADISQVSLLTVLRAEKTAEPRSHRNNRPENHWRVSSKVPP